MTATLLATLDQLDGEFATLAERGDALLDGLSDEKADWQPGNPGKGGWSAGQCVAHLNSTAEAYIPVIRRAIQAAPAADAAALPPFRPGLLARWAVGSMEPPPRFRMPTLRAITPAAHHPAAATAERFASLQRALRTLIAEAKNVDASRVRITSPLSSLVTLRLPATFAFLAAHERRHLWQAEQVRAAQPAAPA